MNSLSRDFLAHKNEINFFSCQSVFTALWYIVSVCWETTVSPTIIPTRNPTENHGKRASAKIWLRLLEIRFIKCEKFHIVITSCGTRMLSWIIYQKEKKKSEMNG